MAERGIIVTYLMLLVTRQDVRWRIGFLNTPFRQPLIYRWAGELSIVINGSRSLVKIAVLLRIVRAMHRSGALIASSFLDECLRSLLSAHLRTGDTSQALLRSGRGVIGTYSARTDLAYALCLIDKSALKALRTIGEIRNAFAHSYGEASFEHPEIAPLCSQLSYAYELFIDQGRGGGDPRETRAALDDFFKKQRNRFTYTCVTLGQTLILAAQDAAGKARSREGV